VTVGVELKTTERFILAAAPVQAAVGTRRKKKVGQNRLKKWDSTRRKLTSSLNSRPRIGVRASCYRSVESGGIGRLNPAISDIDAARVTRGEARRLRSGRSGDDASGLSVGGKNVDGSGTERSGRPCRERGVHVLIGNRSCS
jgi:hypothetical protein